VLDSERDTNFSILKIEIVFRASWMLSGAEIIVDEYNY
jgi:hypothetical protein